MLMEDPLVEELHKIREDMLAEHGGLEGLVKHLREMQAEMAERVVTLPAKPTIATKCNVS
jgi:DNA-binding ferritin-like protein